MLSLPKTVPGVILLDVFISQMYSIIFQHYAKYITIAERNNFMSIYQDQILGAYKIILNEQKSHKCLFHPKEAT